MKKTQITIIGAVLLLGLFLTACSSGQAVLSTPTSSLVTATDTPAPTPTAAPINILMKCDDEAMINSGDYRAENNTWGKGNLSGWSQCIGVGPETDGTIAARWTWDWLNSGSNIKAYPEIIFGQKPGGTTTTGALPVKLSDIDHLTVSYDVSSNNSGSGNVAFDLWLTDTSNPVTFGTPPITHEIMVWIDHQGGLSPGGNFTERASINDSTFAVYVASHWSDGWEYVAFVSPKPRLGADTLDLSSLLAYMQEKNLVTGGEYLASIEFGNEIATGSGETIVKRFSVSLTKK